MCEFFAISKPNNLAEIMKTRYNTKRVWRMTETKLAELFQRIGGWCEPTIESKPSTSGAGSESCKVRNLYLTEKRSDGIGMEPESGKQGGNAEEYPFVPCRRSMGWKDFLFHRKDLVAVKY